MNRYPVGATVTVNFPLVDLNGDPVAPSAVVAKLYDGDSTLLATINPVFAPGDTEVDVAVSASFSAETGPRTIELSMSDGNGNLLTSSEITYLVVEQLKLELLVNSFQTYPAAMFVADSMTLPAEWAAATDGERQNALMEAFRRLTRYGYRIRYPEYVDAFSYVSVVGDDLITPQSWPLVTPDYWSVLPERFKASICRAQIIEASQALKTVAAGPADRRKMGIMSESIGESSMMFRSGKPVERDVFSETLRELTGYIELRITTTRS